jgi:hypothetical protein
MKKTFCCQAEIYFMLGLALRWISQRELFYLEPDEREILKGNRQDDGK